LKPRYNWFQVIKKERIYFFISHILYNALILIVSIIAAKISGPEKWGLITLFLLVSTYSSFLTLGVNNGMGIALPYALGKNSNSDIKHVESTTFTILLATLIPIGIVQFLLIKFLDESLLNWIKLFGYTISFQLITYLRIKLRSHENFKLFTLAYFIQIISISFGIFALIQKYDYLIIIGFGNIISVIFIFIKFKKKININIHMESLNKILKIGFPVMTAGIIGELLLSIDRLIISIFFDSNQLGYYGISSIFFKSIRIIGVAISMMTLPLIVKSFAKKEYNKMLNYSKIQQWLSFGIMGISSIFIGIGQSYFIPHFMPDFKSSISTSYILLTAVSILPLSLYPHILNTIGQQKIYLLAQTIAIGLNILISLAFVYGGLQINSIALASLISIVFYILIIRYLGKKAFNQIIINK
jgi:O-antigen/teichoic acid export membrane protein